MTEDARAVIQTKHARSGRVAAAAAFVAARWLTEPLVHFLLIGLALFAVHHVVAPGPGDRSGSDRVELTEDDLRQLVLVWTAQWRRPPTPEELRNLMDSRVREEILYREALALGLDRGDTIVKRRLAQKMEFLSEDVTPVREPSPDELKAWFDRNPHAFTLPARMSFRHVYFSFDRRGDTTRADAARTREKLAGQTPSLAAVQLGDPFMFQDYYGDRTPQEIANVFGEKFAAALLELGPGSWQGPIESGYGWHVIRIDSMTRGRTLAFEDVEADVRAQWVADERGVAKRKAFEVMRARYVIALPGLP